MLNFLTRPRLLAVFTLGLLGLYYYACWVEPFWLETTRHTILTNVKRPIKIAHLSDLHIRHFGELEQNVIDVLEVEKPDLIAISGDSTISRYGIPALREILSHFHAPNGVWVVKGNWENAVRIPHERKFFEELGIHFLLNEARAARDDLWVIGLDESMHGFPKVDESLKGVPSDVFRLALFHEPGIFNRLAGHINLGLAGHTHGGQIRLPFLPPLFLPQGCFGYVAGWYEDHQSRLYVSRGIGNSMLEARFLARPELAFITLHPNH